MSSKKRNAKKYLDNGYKALENESYSNTLRALNLFNKAKKRISSDDPNNLLVTIGINSANMRRHMINSAKNNYLKHLDKNPNNVSLTLAYAKLCEDICDINSAKSMYEKSLLFTKSTIIYVNLLRNNEQIISLDFVKDLDIKKMESQDKIYMYYILAKLYERQGNFKKSWINYYKYNMSRYSIPITKMMLDTYRKSFKNVRNLVKLEHFPKKIIDNDVPLVFIIGFNKSGINLVSKILNEHKSIYTMDKVSPDFSKIEVEEEKEEKPTLGIGGQEPKKPPRDDSETYYKLFDELYYDLKNIYKESDCKSNVPAKYFSIACSEMYMYLGVIAYLYKNVKIILCERNFNDIGISLYKGHYQNQNMNWTSDLSEIVNFYKFYKENMDFWKISPEIMKTVKYEDLVNNFKTVTGDIQDFLKLDKQDLSYFYQSRIKTTTEDNISINKKIYNTSIDKWKNYEKI
jgi:tetratricopeptide (TPR) repeat protein